MTLLCVQTKRGTPPHAQRVIKRAVSDSSPTVSPPKRKRRSQFAAQNTPPEPRPPPHAYYAPPMAYGSPPNGFQPMPQPPPLNRMYSLPPPGYAPAPFDEMGNPLVGAPAGAFGPGPMLAAPPPHLQPHAFAAFPPHPYAFGPPPPGAYLNALPPEHMYAPPPYAYGPPAWPPFAPAMPPPDPTAFYPMPLSQPPSEADNKFESLADNRLEPQAPTSGSKSPPYQLDMPNIYSSGHSTQRANCHYNLRPLAAHRHYGSSSTNPYQTPYFHNYMSSSEEGDGSSQSQPPPPNAAAEVGAQADADASRSESVLSSYRELQAAGQRSGASSSTTDGASSSALLPPVAEEPTEIDGLWDVFKGLDASANDGDDLGPEGLDLTVRGHALRREELQAESAIDRFFAGSGFDPFGSFNMSSLHLPDLPPGPMSGHTPDLSDAAAASSQIPLPSIDHVRAVAVGAAPGAPFALPPGVNADRRSSFLVGLDCSQHGLPVQNLFGPLDMNLLDVPGIDELPMSNLLLPHPEDSPLHL